MPALARPIRSHARSSALACGAPGRLPLERPLQALKIRRARTDPEPLPDHVSGLENRPEARNLVGILAAVTGSLPENVLREHGGKGFGAFKEVLAEALIAHLLPIATEMRRLLDDPHAIDAALHAGAERARAIADPIVARVQEIVGFLPER